MQENALRRAYKAFGNSQSKMARALGVSQPTIWHWLNKAKRVPAEFVLKVEAETGISRHDLRPDLYPRDDSPPFLGSESAVGANEPNAEAA